MTLVSRLQEFVSIEFGLSSRHSWWDDLPRALEAMAVRHGVPAEVLARKAERNRDLLRELAGYLTINESFFLRDIDQLVFAAEHLLRTHGTTPVRKPVVWSAGCAHGEEPYSLLIACDQLHGALPFALRIIACDLNEEAIERARSAIFSPWSMRDTPQDIRTRYFEVAADGTLQLRQALRALVSFAHRSIQEELDLLGDQSVDLIMCRNVAIYLQEDTIASALGGFRRVMKPDGVLLLAPTDPTPSETLFYRAPRAPPGIYRPASVVDTARSRSSLPSASVVSFARSPQHTAAPVVAPVIAPVVAPAGVLADDECNSGTGQEGKRYYLARGYSNLEKQRFGEALDDFRRVVYLDEGDRIGRFWYADTLNRMGMAKKAAAQLEELARQLKSLPDGTVLEDGVTTASELLRALTLMKANDR